MYLNACSNMKVLQGRALGLFLLLEIGIMLCSASKVHVMTSSGCRQIDKSFYCNILPRDIPVNVTDVYLQDVKQLCNIVKGDFGGKNWKDIKLLKISVTPDEETCSQTVGAYAMENLSGLQELTIVSSRFIGLEKNSFVGLQNLKILNFTGCIGLKIGSITEAITGQLPKLEVISMTYLDIGSNINMGKDFFEALSSKPIKLIDMHHFAFDEIKLEYLEGLLDTLEYINCSESSVNKLDATGTESMTFKHLKLLDGSYSVLPMDILGFLKYLPGMLGHFYVLYLDQFTLISNINTLNLTGINNQKVPINLKHVLVYLTGTSNITWLIQNIIVRDNQLGYLDITIPCNKSPFEELDLSFNSIEFLQPKLCQCCTNLKELNLGNNQLFKMAENNFSIFGQIIPFYPNLQNINLSANKLVRIPNELFSANTRLKIIILSSNLLEQVTFQLEHLKDLEVLDLSSNLISILDQKSLKILKAFENSRIDLDNVKDILKLTDNPISCSTCSALDSIDWLANTKFTQGDKLVCTDENGRSIPIDQNAVKYVKAICEKPLRIKNTILLSVLSPITAITAIVLLSFTLIRCRNKRRFKRNMEERVRLIQENRLSEKYVVFISYSSVDQDFLMEYVYSPLRENLKEKIKTDRELLCMGDMHFRLGKPINDEMVESLEQLAVVVLLLSQDFCRSEYCRMEFDHAIQLNKPIILMVKGEVDPGEMVPSLRELFNTKTRILWEKHGDKYTLKTSWDNICISILELVQY